MGKLTKEVFNESCCDGGCMNLDPQKSAQPCGCDEGANWMCERHKAEMYWEDEIMRRQLDEAKRTKVNSTDATETE
jgi:hypothetical protein